MALLQIAEPGQSATPHNHKLAVGIDLGTTNSLVAAVRSGKASTLPDSSGRHGLPSVVRYTHDGVIVGEEAEADSLNDPDNTLVSVKRYMGKSVDDLLKDSFACPYKVSGNEQGAPSFVTARGEISPIQASSDILQPLIKRAEATLGGTLEGVVITVPAYFDDAQRQGTKDAAALLGIKVLRLLNEPTAAAIAYGLDSEQEGVIAVYDLGGGTFDISVLRLSKGVFEVMSTGGNSALGGDDFDRAIAELLRQQWQLEDKDSKTERQLLVESRRIKEALTTQEQVQATLKVGVKNLTHDFSRKQFNLLIEPLVKQTIRACRQALRDAKVTGDEVVQTVLVGGSTRVPMVREQVELFFKKAPLTSVDPDRVVAIGAAIQADILVGNKPDNELLLLDVIPLSLGVETMGGLVEKVVSRNTTIPVARAQEFTTFKDGQTAMSFHVVQGERELVADCRSLAKFILTGIPPMAAGGAHIRITFQVDADGLLNVTAMEKSTGVQSSIEVKPSFGLTESEIATMLTESMTHAKDDIVGRMLAEQKVEASRMLESLSNALNKDGQLLTEPERSGIEGAMAQLAQCSTGDDKTLIENTIKQLDKLTQIFAQKRMDYSIRTALKGQSVDKL